MTDETRDRIKDEILDILRNSDYAEHEDTWEILDDKVDEILDILRDSEELGISKHSYRKESNG